METTHAAAMKEMATTVAALEARTAELEGAAAEKDAETAALTAERDSLRGTAQAASGAELRAAEVAVEQERALAALRASSQEQAAASAAEIESLRAELETSRQAHESAQATARAELESLQQELGAALQRQLEMEVEHADVVATLEARAAELEAAVADKDASAARVAPRPAAGSGAQSKELLGAWSVLRESVLHQDHEVFSTHLAPVVDAAALDGLFVELDGLVEDGLSRMDLLFASAAQEEEEGGAQDKPGLSISEVSDLGAVPVRCRSLTLRLSIYRPLMGASPYCSG